MIEAAKAAKMVMGEVEAAAGSRSPHAVTRESRPALRQPIFDWKVQGKYNELNNFNIKERSIFMMNSYSMVKAKSANNYDMAGP